MGASYKKVLFSKSRSPEPGRHGLCSLCIVTNGIAGINFNELLKDVVREGLVWLCCSDLDFNKSNADDSKPEQ